MGYDLRMLPRTPLVALATLLLVASPVAAQPGAPAPAPAPSPPPGPPPPPEQERLPAPPPDVTAIYQHAFAALLANDLAAASAGFAAAAASATDPELRGAARELGRLADELAARQGRIVLGATTTTPPPHGDREDPDEGRAGIIVTSTLASIYAGVVFSDLADTSDARAVTGIIVGTTGLGFLASLYGTRGRTISGGTAEAYSLGMLLGAANGLLLAEPFGASTSEQWQTTIFGGMALAAGAGFYYGHTRKPTRGQVSFAGTMATMGVATVGLGLIVTLPDIDDPDNVLIAMAGGLDAGAAAGLVLGRDLTWSAGRARLVWLGALLGGLGGLATGVLLFGDGESDNGDTEARVAAGLTLGGAWGGLLLGARLTRNMRPDTRYRSLAALDHHVVPIAMPHGAGLGIAGRF